MKLDQIVALLDNPILGFLGISPKEILASLIMAGILAFVPELVSQIRELVAKLRQTPSKFDDVAVPVLEAIADKLEDGARNDAGMQDLSKLIAAAAWDGAKDPKKAKQLVKQLSRDLARKGLDEVERQMAKQAQAIANLPLPAADTKVPDCYDPKADDVKPGM